MTHTTAVFYIAPVCTHYAQTEAAKVVEGVLMNEWTYHVQVFLLVKLQKWEYTWISATLGRQEQKNAVLIDWLKLETNGMLS